jgi:hypothetical protein
MIKNQIKHTLTLFLTADKFESSNQALISRATKRMAKTSDKPFREKYAIIPQKIDQIPADGNFKFTIKAVILTFVLDPNIIADKSCESKITIIQSKF